MKIENAIFEDSPDTRVRYIRAVARSLRADGALTPQLQEAISDLNAEACRNFNRQQPKNPKRKP